jgi:hypothetical protein
MLEIRYFPTEDEAKRWAQDRPVVRLPDRDADVFEVQNPFRPTTTQWAVAVAQ